MKHVLLSIALLWITSTGFSQTAFFPDPDNATLILYTDQWALWNVTKAMETTFPRSSYESLYYLQRQGDADAQLVYKAIEGQIQSFSPVWVHSNGTVIGWDINFNFLADGVEPAGKEPVLPNSTYYPVLVNCNAPGVVLMANNEHSSTDVTAPLYFLSWSYDHDVVDYRDPRPITDSSGVPFYSSRVFMATDKILSYRPPYFFWYDIKTSRQEIVQVDDFQNTSEVVAFDGSMVVFKNGNTLFTYIFKSKRLNSISVSEDCMVLTCRGLKIYCIQGQALTKSDSLNLMLQSYDLNKAVWTTHKEVFSGDYHGDNGAPVHMILKDRLRVWTNKRWFEITW